ncbi:MAG TPA: hypothetical protein DCQ97_07690 [Chitinophagaceae bacterium]|nr:hypothetical protein [Chitinophagaceae bacterium]
MAKFRRISLISFFLIAGSFFVNAQVNSVEFGKNRVQYKKFKWKYYQTRNFNVYYYQNGEELAKFIAQSAEKELPQIEAAAEYSLQRRANIVLYNEYADMLQSNIGLEIDWQNTGGGTKLVNNKMVVYFEADHQKLRLQIRKGIAQVITENRLFGDDIGEVAGNQALLDLPKWLTDGYISYLAQNWSTELDDELKSEMLSGNYSKFTRFAYAKPELAGHAFWFYIDEKYKKENVTYLLYLATVYKNLNRAFMQVCKKKFKEVLVDFMEYQDDKYYKDIAKRKPYPKGNYIDGFDINTRLDYFRFNVNPNKRNNSYVVTQYRKGIVRVIYNDDFTNKTLLKFGIRSYKNSINPNYPMMAWDPKGTRIAVLYSKEGKLNLFVYDVVTRIKQYKIDLTKQFDQVQDMKYMLNSNTLVLSAVKNGHTDIFTLELQSEKVRQITNDVYDDLDASFVAFPNKTGIIFSSNRPTAMAKTSDTALPSDHHYNIFLITDFGDKPELNQITQLSNVKYGNARFPMQYNESHFTFVSDENGVGNRYAGFFTTKKAGLDTLVLISGEIMRNPSAKEVDSALRVYKKTDVDSVAVVSISEDSAYTFPLTNYQSTLGETRIAGDNNQVSEVTRQSDEKILYKLKIDEATLRRRNITAQPTEYMKKLMGEYVDTAAVEKFKKAFPADTAKKQDDFFQTEFASEKKDSTAAIAAPEAVASNGYNVLKTIKNYRYKPPKFSVDYGSVGLNSGSAVLINRFQPYAGGGGPIQLNSGTPLNGLIRLGTVELLEDQRISGGFRVSTNLKDNEWFMTYQNYKRRIDWGLTYYRNVQQAGDQFGNFLGRYYTNLYQVNVAYPFDNSKSLRLTTGIRSDKFVYASQDPASLVQPDEKTIFSTTHLEYVYDNTLYPAMNIWNGLRYKFFIDWNRQINKVQFADGPTMFNFGFDARYYYPILRNFIWAGRVAGDFSWGNQKMIYYLGGVDGWLMFGQNQKFDQNGNLIKERYFNTSNPPDPDQNYAFQSLAVNMRGYIQNVANGNNAMVINSELRLPIMSTFFDRTVNNAFLRNFQLVQFIDLGTAWNGSIKNIERPTYIFGPEGSSNPVTVRQKAGGIGPLAGGYGFGVRSTLLGYFMKLDTAWPMNGLFLGKPTWYFALGFDF